MGKSKRRYVGKAEAGVGWRIWDNKVGRWWGEPFSYYPDALLKELNGAKRPEHLTELQRRR